MLVFESIHDIDVPNPGKPVHLAVGTFDGVHLAHAALLGRVGGEAHATGGQSLVFTFRNHPRSVTAPERRPPLITPWPLKRRLLERLPIDIVVAVEFDEAIRAIPAQEFIGEVLVGRCRARTIHSGWNFRFGQGGYGGPGLLADLAEEFGYRYERIEPITAGGRRVSSTLVRERLVAGEVAEAAQLLGRPHQVWATVVTGDAIGRTIGFPTANLSPGPEILVPDDGVYAVQVFVGEEREPRPGMMNIGWRPTVGGRDHRIEVHLIGFEGDLVGRELTVQFVRRLRGERKFDGPDALAAQLALDRAAAIDALRDVVGERF